VRQVGLRGERDLGREVAEVVVVGDFLRVQRRAPAVAELLRVVDAGEPPVASRDAIVRQVLAVDLAGELRLQVAELVAQLQPALGEELGRHRGVHVLGDVPVVRQRRLEAALARGAEGGREEARAALVVERERDVRHVEDRHAEEVERRVVRGAHVARAVDVELANAQVPVVARHRARGVLGAEEAALLLLAQLGARRLAARRDAPLRGLGEFEDRRLHLAGAVVEAVAQARAGGAVAVALEAHGAGGDRGLVGGVVLHAVGADARAALAQDHVAGGDHLVVALGLDAVGLEELRAVALEARGGHVELALELQSQAVGKLRGGDARNCRAEEGERQRPYASRPQGVFGCEC